MKVLQDRERLTSRRIASASQADGCPPTLEPASGKKRASSRFGQEPQSANCGDLRDAAPGRIRQSGAPRPRTSITLPRASATSVRNPSDVTIWQALSRMVELLRLHELDQARATLDGLGFERLLYPHIVRRNGQQKLIDPAEYFGLTRAYQTADYLRACDEALDSGNLDRALYAAVAAMLRWKDDDSEGIHYPGTPATDRSLNQLETQDEP